MIFFTKKTYIKKKCLNIVLTFEKIKKISHFYFIFAKLKANNNNNFKDILRI